MAASPSLAPVVCIGEILIDLIAPPGESLATAQTFAIREGGAPMNAAVALARLRMAASFCGVVGDDPFGQRLRALLEHEGVDCSALRATSEAPTSLAYAWRNERGDGQFQLMRLADKLLSGDDVGNAGIAGAGAMLVGSVALAASPSREAIYDAIELAREHDIPVMFDVNVRPPLWGSQSQLYAACEPVLQHATLLKLSLDDARCLWGAETLAEAISHAGGHDPWLTVVTDGSRGLVVKQRGLEAIREFPVVAVEAVDPTGAGDAFTAALVTRMARSGWVLPSDEDIRFAMAAGALATTRQGALTALPRLIELERFLADYG
ncbi:MAG: carbohydrate kinase [Chloroflexia bacterium]|nr:carbohydrate kinase [Chloroflexia bacterium]